MGERIYFKGQQSGLRSNTLLLGLGLLMIVMLCLLGGWFIWHGVNRPSARPATAGAPGDTTPGTPAATPAQPLTASVSGNGTPVPVAGGSNAQSPAGNESAPGTAPPAQSVGGDLPIVCIDPGHPSEVNRGTTVQNGLQEVQITYDVALKLKAYLEDQEHPIARVVMTRDFREGTGKIVTNRRRAEIANIAGAALLLRLHCDTGSGSGYTIYYPDRVGTAADGKVGPTAQVIRESYLAASALEGGMEQIMTPSLPNLPNNGVKGDSATYVGRKQGALTGSVYAQEPALTVEMVYLSNPNDAKMIGSEAGQQMMAEALGNGVQHALVALEHRE